MPRNAGVVGYGTTNALDYFKNEGFQYNADLVVLMFYAGNDIFDNLNPAHYKIENDTLVPIDFIYGANIGTPPWAREGTFFRQVRNFLYTQSRLYSVFVELGVYTFIQQSETLSDFFQSIGFAEAARPVINAGNIYTYLRPSEEAWDMTERLLLALNNEVTAQGSQFLVVIIPDETEVDVEKWTALSARYPDLFDTVTPAQQPSARIADMLEQHTINTLSLQPIFLEHYQQNDTLLYYPYDGHWTPAGHQIAADTLYQHFSDLNPEWLPK